MKLIDYNLPEFVFLDGSGHDGSYEAMKDRTVIQHVRSYTVFEAVALDGMISHSFNTPNYEFNYTNFAGIVEKHMLVLHFSIGLDSPSVELEQLFEKTAQWYCDYLTWEDRNIIEDYGSANN